MCVCLSITTQSIYSDMLYECNCTSCAEVVIISFVSIRHSFTRLIHLTRWLVAAAAAAAGLCFVTVVQYNTPHTHSLASSSSSAAAAPAPLSDGGGFSSLCSRCVCVGLAWRKRYAHEQRRTLYIQEYKYSTQCDPYVNANASAKRKCVVWLRREGVR